MGVKVRERTMGALVILLVCLISTAALADESYLCIGEHATGFGYDNTNKSWSAARFKANKWIVKRSTNPQFKWIVFEFGEKISEDFPITCQQDFYPNGDLFSDPGGVQFRLNKNTLLFFMVIPIGYWYYGDEKSMYGIEGKFMPSMEIGKCSKI